MAKDKSVASGDWSDSDSWNAGVPTSTSDVTISNNNAVTLDVAGAVNSLTVNAKGVLDLDGAKLSSASAIVDKGEIIGNGVVNTDISGNGKIVADGGVLELKGAIGADNQNLALQIDSGATLKVDGAVGAASSLFDGKSETTINFIKNGELDLSGEGGREQYLFQATVENFVASDKIDVAGAAGDEVHFNAKTDILTITNAAGAVEEQIQLSGNYKNQAFNLTYDAATHKDTVTVSAICFMAGTMIRTPGGEVPVESLKRGDLVLSADGTPKPVTWLGRQTISTIFSDPIRVWPIRIKAGALAENVPSRDLVLSPDHAVFVDGALIQAGALVNGSSIVRENNVPRVFTYYHIELDDHSVILAEGTPAETFIDNVERLAFDNWAEHEELYPDGKDMVELPYSRAKSQRQVPVSIRVLLAERAQKLGYALEALSA